MVLTRRANEVFSGAGPGLSKVTTTKVPGHPVSARITIASQHCGKQALALLQGKEVRLRASTRRVDGRACVNAKEEQVEKE